MIIRAITLFYPTENNKIETNELKNELTKLKDTINKTSEKHGIEVRTWRLTLPFIEPTQDYEELAVTIGRIATELGYIHSTLNIPINTKISSDTLITAFLKSEAYMSIWVANSKEVDENNTILYTEVMKKLVELNAWHTARRIAALIGNPILTPYYPDSINISNKHGIALSLLYTNDILNGKERITDTMREVFKKAEGIGREIAEELGIEYLGIDTSLSPWGKHSVVKVIEETHGIKFGDLGTLNAVYNINRNIWEAMTSIRATGFNEVMLPLAEDEELKARVREGLVTFAKLMNYTTACVAGIDMIPIPAGQINKIPNLIQDLHTISRIKQRTLGLRLIPYPGNESEVDMGDFGLTPVMDMRG